MTIFLMIHIIVPSQPHYNVKSVRYIHLGDLPFGTVDGMVIQFKSVKNVGGVINSFGFGWTSDYTPKDKFLFLEIVNAEGWSGMQIETV